MEKKINKMSDSPKNKKQTKKSEIKKAEDNSQYTLEVTDDKKVILPTSNNNIGKGEILEYRIKRLFFAMGYYVHNNIFIQTGDDEPYDIVTDLDVYGVYVHNDFNEKRIWADCKSGNANELNRISWLIGVKALINSDEVLFVKKGVKFSTKLFASQRNIQIIDLAILDEIEKRYEIEKNDWKNLWNPDINHKNIDVFKRIQVPDNQTYKRIYKYISTYYWTTDKYAKVKKTITALKELAVAVQYPLEMEEKKAIEWAVYKLIGLFVLAVFGVCKDVFYLNNDDKKQMIVEGLTFGNVSKKRMDGILKVTNHLANKIIETSCKEPNIVIPEIQLNPPEYTEALLDFVFRIINNPQSYFDILRFVDFCLMQYDFVGQEYNYEEIRKYFSNYEGQISAEKTILHFICHVAGIPKDMFILLK